MFLNIPSCPSHSTLQTTAILLYIAYCPSIPFFLKLCPTTGGKNFSLDTQLPDSEAVTNISDPGTTSWPPEWGLELVFWPMPSFQGVWDEIHRSLNAHDTNHHNSHYNWTSSCLLLSTYYVPGTVLGAECVMLKVHFLRMQIFVKNCSLMYYSQHRKQCLAQCRSQ